MTPPARRKSLPAWLGKAGRGNPAGSRWPRRLPRRPRLALRRHARPALLALVVAAGVAFARSGDVGLLLNTQGSDTGAVPSGSTPAAVAVAPIASAPAAPSSSTAPAASSTAPAASSTAPAASSTAPAASSTAPVASSTASAIPPTVTVVGSVPAGSGVGGLADGQPASAAADVVAAALQIVDLPANPARRRAQTWEAPAPPTDLVGYVWPLPGGRITDPFGPSRWGSRVADGQLFHDGIDIATYCGDRILAAHGGLVLAAGRRFDQKIGWVGDLGPYFALLDKKQIWWTLPITVVIDDGNGYRSIYAHFSQVVVKVGQRVRAGQLIGYEGATGRATGCHLHYGLFSPHETATLSIEPGVVKRMLVPAFEIARIDPLLVLPPRGAGPATVVPRPPGGDATGANGIIE